MLFTRCLTNCTKYYTVNSKIRFYIRAKLVRYFSNERDSNISNAINSNTSNSLRKAFMNSVKSTTNVMETEHAENKQSVTFAAPSTNTTTKSTALEKPKLPINNYLDASESLLKEEFFVPNDYNTQKGKKSNQSKHPPSSSTLKEFRPKVCVIGVGGGGCNAVNNMVSRGLFGVDFICTNTDAQHLSHSLTEKKIQIGRNITEGLGCGANPDIGRQAALESKDEIIEMIDGAHLVFITAGMGGGTGTGAAPVIAEICSELGILTIAVVTKPFTFEGRHRSRLAMEGIKALQDRTDSLIVIPNQNIFQLVDQTTSFIDAYKLADDVLLAGVKSITDLIMRPGLINLDFADVKTVMSGMGNALMGTGQAEGEDRAVRAAKDAMSNPLLGGIDCFRTAKGMLVNITGGQDLTLFELEKAAQHIGSEIKDENANIIFGSSFDESLTGSIRVSVVATGIEDFPSPVPPAVKK